MVEPDPCSSTLEVTVKRLTRVASILAIAALGATAAAAATQSDDDDEQLNGDAAPDGRGASPAHAVFVQTNDPARNAIVVYDRESDGSLRFAATYLTGGKGSRTIGAPSDPLASQGSLVYDRARRLLFAVNAGSDTVSIFDVEGDRLALNQVVPSGGPFPVSIAVRGKLVYVLDAGLAGFVSGFRIEQGRVEPIEGSTRTLGLANTNPPFFLSSPAQVGFTRDGNHLRVTTKSFNFVEEFQDQQDGQLSAQPGRNPEAPLPFRFIF